jgi:PAS domain S-box-containing protein
MTYIGNTPSAIFALVSMYILISLIVYAPLNSLFPQLTMKSVLRQLEYWRSDNSDDHARQLIENLLDLPLRHALVVFLTSYPGFVIGPLLAYTGIVADWQDIIPAITVVSAAIGFAVCSIQGFLVYTMTEERLRHTIEYVASQHSSSIEHVLQYQRIPLIQKIFVLTLLAVVASQFSLVSFLIAKISVVLPEEFWTSIGFLGACMLLSVGYVYLAVNFFIGTISRSFARLKQWSRQVVRGDLESEVVIVTNDEITDVVQDIQEMVDKLNAERKRVKEQKDTLDVILSGIVDGVIAVDEKGTVLLMNPAAEKIIAHKEAAATGKHIQEVLQVYEEQKQLFTDYYYPIPSLSSAADSEIKNWEALRVVDARGEERYVNLVVSPLSALGGERGCIVMFHDVTKEKQLEEMKLDFVSIAAHELRSPLTSVLGYLSVFLEENRATLNDDQNQLLNRVQASAQQLRGLVENLLSVTKIERRVLTLSLQRVDWVSIVEQSVSDLSFPANDKHIELTFVEPQEAVPAVDVDVMRIKEVLSNLIANAINYTPPDGKIEVSIEVTNNEVITHVKDTGIGIPSEAIPSLFKKFYRVSGKKEESATGTGLGLYISKTIVQMHHGTIWVESELDRGSTFSFSLPQANFSEN